MKILGFKYRTDLNFSNGLRSKSLRNHRPTSSSRQYLASAFFSYVPKGMYSKSLIAKTHKDSISPTLQKFKSLHILIVIFFTSIALLQAQVNPPNFLCISNDTLIWEIPSNTCGAFNSYQIFGSQDINGPFNLISTITDQNQERFFHDHRSDMPWFYYLNSDFNCPGETILNSDTINNSLPEKSPIISVSVEMGMVVVQWQESPSPEVIEYVILRNTSSGTAAIETSPGGNAFIDITASPAEQSETYFVNAQDACGNNSLFDEPHSTMLLQVDSINACEQTINMSWNTYEGWMSGIARQEIWMSLNGSDFNLIETLTGESSNYQFENADDGNTYCFYVRAVQEGMPDVSSKSNETCETLDIVQPVRNFVLKNATIEADSSILVEWAWNSNAELQSYMISSALMNSGIFETLENVDVSPPLSEVNTYIDNSLSSIDGPVAYKINSLDDCGKMDSTNIVSTIFLSGNAGESSTNFLEWIPYSNPFGIVTNYEIHRISGNKEELISMVEGNSTTFGDILDQAVLNEGPACYYVVAIIELILPTGDLEIAQSRSNTICLEQEASVFVPNAFIPDGTLNREFKPVLQFGSPQEYSLVIFDRWGQQIFQSTSFDIGWDGKKDTQELPQGVYLYYLRVVQNEGKTTEKKGTVLLLR